MISLKRLLEEIEQELGAELKESETAEEAKRQGLEYFGFGRYGKDGKVTHKSDNGKLVKIGLLSRAVDALTGGSNTRGLENNKYKKNIEKVISGHKTSQLAKQLKVPVEKITKESPNTQRLLKDMRDRRPLPLHKRYPKIIKAIGKDLDNIRKWLRKASSEEKQGEDGRIKVQVFKQLWPIYKKIKKQYETYLGNRPMDTFLPIENTKQG